MDKTIQKILANYSLPIENKENKYCELMHTMKVYHRYDLLLELMQDSTYSNLAACLMVSMGPALDVFGDYVLNTIHNIIEPESLKKVIFSLGWCFNQSSHRALIFLLHHKNPLFRLYSTFVLGQVALSTSMYDMTRMLNDNELTVREMANFIISWSGGNPFVRFLTQQIVEESFQDKYLQVPEILLRIGTVLSLDIKDSLNKPVRLENLLSIPNEEIKIYKSHKNLNLSENKNFIFFTGFSGSGKSTIVERISKQFDIPLIDTDKKLSQKFHKPISDLFNELGEDHFRSIETQLIFEILDQSPQRILISTGGGMPLSKTNRQLMSSYGESVFIDVNSSNIISRLSSSKKGKDHAVVDLLSYSNFETNITWLLDYRRPFYELSKYIVNNNYSLNKMNLFDLLQKLSIN